MPRLFVSLSHDGDYVVATVVAEEDEGRRGSGGSGVGGRKDGVVEYR